MRIRTRLVSCRLEQFSDGDMPRIGCPPNGTVVNRLFRATVPVPAAAPLRPKQGRQPLPNRVVNQVIGHARRYQSHRAQYKSKLL